MATVVTTSKRFSLQLTDWQKALIMSILTPSITIIAESLNSGSLTFDWKHIGIAALSGAVAYLTKNFLSPAQTVIKGKDQPDIEKVQQLVQK